MENKTSPQRPRRVLLPRYVPITHNTHDFLCDHATPVTIWQLSLDEMRLDGGTQARVSISTLLVDEYSRAMQAGAQFPPVVVFRDGQNYWLADGYHRVYAAKQAGLLTIAAEIQPGTLRNAILYAVGANAKHGLRRSNADKRHAVHMLLQDEEWRQWSDREIARRCGVHHDLVGKVRTSLAETASDLRVYRNRYGHITTMHTGSIGKQQEPAFDAIASIPVTIRQLVSDIPLADQHTELLELAKITDLDKQIAVTERLLHGEAMTVREAIRQLAYADKQIVTLQEVVQGRYPVLYCDPPWQYSNARLQGAAAAHYPTMSIEAICALPVAEYTTTNAVLFLWATNPLLKDALTVLEAWGFQYRTNLVWVKNTATYGKLGFYTHGRHELLLIGVRGSCLPKAGCLPDSVLTAKKGRHSAKPVDVYALIEQMYDGPYLELFARQIRSGWTSFSNEIRERPAQYEAQGPVSEITASLQVLLVEDDADVRDLLNLLLTVAGCQVTTASNIDDAQQLLYAGNWDVLVTDFHLPDGLGQALIQQVQDAGLPVTTVLMSAEQDIEALAVACQADACFWKGNDISRLVTLVITIARKDETSEG